MPTETATESTTTTTERRDSNGMDNDRLRIIMQTVGTYGVPAVLVVLFYAQVYKPDQDNRRELEKMNSQTLIQVGNTMQMLVDQDRRREASTSEMLRIQADQTRTMQEQTRILQEIMVDQKRGAWNDKRPSPPRSPGDHAVIPPNQ
jgi:23S rRNA G2069 N7-methylase RlmK/C1962 C5-methylase RlmI